MEYWEEILLASVNKSVGSVTEKAGGSIREETREWIVQNTLKEFKKRLLEARIDSIRIINKQNNE